MSKKLAAEIKRDALLTAAIHGGNAIDSLTTMPWYIKDDVIVKRIATIKMLVAGVLDDLRQELRDDARSLRKKAPAPSKSRPRVSWRHL